MIIESFVNFLSKIMFFSSFVNTATGFPKPLTPEQEQEYIKAYQNGDMEARNKLIEHNLRLVVHIVKKYSSADEADDLISVGTIGLIKAINTFSQDKGSQLSTYASRCIENEILMLLRLNKKHNQVYSLEESLGSDKDGNEITLSDVISGEVDEVANGVENCILNEQLNALMKQVLPKREYEIICLRYGVNNTPALPQRIVAKKLNISRSYISRLETKALNTIRQEVKKRHIFG